MPFRVKKPPQINTSSLDRLGDSTIDLAKYVDDEFAEVASAFQNPDPFQILNVAPPKPRQGMLIYADGTHWNPGSGEGLYVYGSDAAWHFLEVTPYSPPTVNVFRVHLNTQQLPSSGVTTKVTFDTSDFDTGTFWDNTNHQFKPSVAGYWEFRWNLYTGDSSSLSAVTSSLFKNGGESARGSGGTGQTFGSVGSDIVSLNGSTDFVDIRANLTATTPKIGTATPSAPYLCVFSGNWLRA